MREFTACILSHPIHVLPASRHAAPPPLPFTELPTTAGVQPMPAARVLGAGSLPESGILVIPGG